MLFSLFGVEVLMEREEAFTFEFLTEKGKGGNVYRWLWYRVTVS